MGIKGEFVIRIGDQLLTYHDYDQIPKEFDHVISFKPTVPPSPHSQHEHDEIDSWHDLFQKLMEIEHASSNKKR